MADLHPIAKRIHNIQPKRVRLELDAPEYDEVGVFQFTSTEFFQREFRGEGSRVDADEDAAFRLISSEDHERILLGRQGPDEEGWAMVGEVVAAEPAETGVGDSAADDSVTGEPAADDRESGVDTSE